MSQATLPSLISAGITRHYGVGVEEQDWQVNKVYHMDTTNRRFLDVQGMVGWGAPQRRNIGGTFAMTAFQEDYPMRYVMDSYGLGTAIPEEDLDDDQYGFLARYSAAAGGEFARKFNYIMEYVGFNFFATLGYTASTGLTGTSDGLSLFNTAHPVSRPNSATTVSNRLSSGVQLSYASYQAAAVALRNQKQADNLLYNQNKVTKLVTHSSQYYVVNQILKLDMEYGTANRNTNLIKLENVEPVLSNYFIYNSQTGASSAWFLLGDNHALQFIIRQKLRVKTDYDIATNSHLFIGSCRFGYGGDTWRGTQGSPGA